MTKKGTQCKLSAQEGSKFCKIHKDVELEVADKSKESTELSNDNSSVSNTDNTSTGSENTRTTRGMKRSKSVKPQGGSEVSYSKEVYESEVTDSIDNVNAKIEELATIVNGLKEQVTTIATSKTKSKPKKAPKERAPWETTDKRAVFAAKWAFYRENKDNVDIVKRVRDDLIKANRLIIQRKTVNGAVIMKECIHYTMIKQETDMLFEALSEDAQAVYIKQVVDKFEEKKSTKTGSA
jgi:glutaredoxin 2